MDLLTLAKIVGPVSSGIFAGYTWALSDATVPSILEARDDATRARQWRVQYIQGFLVAVPCTILNIASWVYLAFKSPPETRLLFILAAIGTGSGTVFAWTVLRSTNGALSIRTHSLAGAWNGFFQIPLTYSSGEQGSRALEKRDSTVKLVEAWGRLNFVRGLVLIAGTIFGMVGLALL